MEIQPGVFVYDAASLRVALEHMRTTLSQTDWVLLQEEMRRMGMSVPTRPSTSKNSCQELTQITRVLPQKELEEVFSDYCAICCDNHRRLESLTTCCGHCFGKECFDQWANVCKRDQKRITCPMCKNEIKSITTYRTRT